MKKINNLLSEIISGNTLIKIIFGGVRKKSQLYQKVEIRPVLLHDQLFYQVEYHHTNKVIHENLDGKQCLKVCEKLISQDFKQVNLFTAQADYQILAAKPENPRIIKRQSTKQQSSLEHNKIKQYIIPDGKPCDFLIRLGVMSKGGQVSKKHYAKFRQINKFLEIISDVLEYLPDSYSQNQNTADNKEPVRIIDFGCGKAYLTFALYYYLKLNLQRNIQIIGLDLKEDAIDFCNLVARDLQYDGLAFLKGDIAEYTDGCKADMVVTLHACDTATDHALIKAVGWDASVILSVPCCQHELFNQIQNTLHKPILKHGILNERFASILTDGLRCLKLEEQGYDVALVEFTSLEHTAKNIMIRAVKTGRKNKAAGEDYQRLLEYWHVHPTIDKL